MMSKIIEKPITRCDWCGKEISKCEKPIRHIYWWEPDKKYLTDWYCKRKHFDEARDHFGIKEEPVRVSDNPEMFMRLFEVLS